MANRSTSISPSRINKSAMFCEANEKLELKEDRAIYRAISILERRLARACGTVGMNGAAGAKEFLVLGLAQKEREEFIALWLDARHRLICADTMFVGTLTQTAVYPREVVKCAIWHNAAAVIFAHNHPSGDATPSRADLSLTNALRTALALVDVKVLDHIIVAGTSTLSFAEGGLI